jgi:hypothetical protein
MRGCGAPRARWDDMHIDLDLYGFGYLAFALGVAAVVWLVRGAAAELRGRPGPLVAARKLMIATLVAMLLFVGRFLMEHGVGLDWAALVGPAAVIAAIAGLRPRSEQTAHGSV